MKQNAESVLISSDGIRNSLKKYKPLQALCECIWNGFDANASCIRVFIDENILSGTARITVEDNGTGIDRNQLGQKFKPFFQSEKVFDPEIKHSTTHGKNGVGRLTFFTFANFASWTAFCGPQRPLVRCPAVVRRRQRPDAKHYSTVLLTRASIAHDFMAKRQDSAFGRVCHGKKPIMRYSCQEPFAA